MMPMRIPSRWTLCFLIVWYAVTFAPALSAAQGRQKASEPCQFTHQNYVGVCTVQPRGDETCKSILTYLNKANSAGKSYCNDTILRGGWKKAAPPDSKKKPKASGS